MPMIVFVFCMYFTGGSLAHARVEFCCRRVASHATDILNIAKYHTQTATKIAKFSSVRFLQSSNKATDANVR